MRIEILFSLVMSIVNVYGNTCTIDQDCVVSTGTDCTLGWLEICEHPHPDQGTHHGGGLCTCKRLNYTCTVKSDCQISDCTAGQFPHCYDGGCICSKFHRK